MVKWEDGELVTPAYVNEDCVIVPAVYAGKTPLNAHNLNKMQEKDIITTNIKNNMTITSTDYTKIPFKEIYKIGSKLSITEDGEILIGAGINYIKVTANVLYVSLKSGIKNIKVFKNNLQKSTVYKNFGGTSAAAITDTLAIPCNIIQVAEGDLISLRVKGDINDLVGGQGDEAATFLTIEAVG